MFQVRIHGRGGQGVVTGAEVLSVAAFLRGKHAQAFPSFGSERMGAPVMAFCRIDDKEIRLRDPVTRPDALIIQDPTLLHQVSVFDGLSKSGWVLINSARGLKELGVAEHLSHLPAGHVRTIGATEIALRHVGRPVPNAVLLGALCAMTGLLPLESVQQAISKKFPGAVGAKNSAAAAEAFEAMSPEGATTHA